MGQRMNRWSEDRAADRAAALLAYSLVLAVLTGCERASPTPTSGSLPREGDLIVLLGPPTASPQGPAIAGGARRVIERYPLLRLETMTPADNHADTLLRTASQALAKQPRAVCMYVSAPQAASAAAEAVVRQAVILVTLGVQVDVTGVFGHVREDLTGAAGLLGNNLDRIIAGRQSYLLLHRAGADATQTHCYERFLTAARSYGTISLLDEQNAADEQQQPVELIRAMFARFPNAGLVVTLEPGAWLSTDPAEVLARGARFATVGAAPPLWGHLRSGRATALAGVLDGELGSLAADLAVAAITDSHAAGKVRIASAELVTRETLDDFAKRYAETAGLDVQELLAAPPAAPSRP